MKRIGLNFSIWNLLLVNQKIPDRKIQPSPKVVHRVLLRTDSSTNMPPLLFSN